MGTPPLSLEPLVVDDASALADALADPDLYLHIGGEPPSVEDLRATIGHYIEGPGEPGEAWHNWAIRVADAGDGAGRATVIGQLQATVRDHGRSAEIAWIVGTPWQGNGYATEAAQWLVDWLTEAGAEEIVAHVAPANVASARVAAKACLEPTDEVDDGEIVWRLRLAGRAVGDPGDTGAAATP